MGMGVVVGDLMAAGDGSPWSDKAESAATRKRRGEVAETAFLVKAVSLGFRVAKPWGDSERYDFLVDAGEGLRRVQVKSSYRLGDDGGYSFRLHGHSLEVYAGAEIDALVAYVVPEGAWYVFPVKVFEKRRSVKLYPGSRRKRSKFEKYREAWWVLG